MHVSLPDPTSATMDRLGVPHPTGSVGLIGPTGTASTVSIDVSGFVHSWDVSIGVDGPGTRFTLFTAGCPLRCLYCENPDTWSTRGGRVTTVTDVMTRIERYHRMLAADGGGVTVSGGEPLSQPQFTGAVLHACHEAGLHTALDTSGYLGHQAGDDLLADVDLVLLDLKSFQPDLYRKVTGRELAPTLRFAERLAALDKRVWVRFVLVPGLTDLPENVQGLADYVAELENVDRVDVLGYHRLGVPRYQALGRPYRLAGTPEPTETQLAAVRAVFAEAGAHRGLVVT